MNRKIFVSIIITTYNRANFIEEALNSVLAQTYINWEIIIIDDGSTDNTKDIVNKYLYNNKIFYYYQNNTKQAGALNTGLKYAKGEWIAFLDSDNRWLPNRLESAIKHINIGTNAGLIYGDIYTINESGKRISDKNMKRFSGKVTSRLLFDNFITFNTTLIKKNILDKIGGFNSNLERAPDYDCWLRASTVTNVLYIKEYLADYRIMDDQISTDKTARLINNEKTLKRFIENYGSYLTNKEINKGYSAFYLRKARYYKGERRYIISIHSLLTSLLYYPFWHAPWKSIVGFIIKHKKNI